MSEEKETSSKLKPEDLLAMPDDEFMEKSIEIDSMIEKVEHADENKEASTEQNEDDSDTGSEDSDQAVEEEASTDEKEEVADPTESTEDSLTEASSAAEEPEEKATRGTSEAKTEVPDKIDYKEFYDRVTAPFKANGKVITLKTAEEAIQLQQQGANYTKKMQSIAPYRKVLLMLEKNNLLDEDKLSFLIDLDQKDPKAIQKYLKDSKIDPLDIDIEGDSQYKEGSHRISDQEAAFTTVLEEVKGQSRGVETLQEINSNWDDASKQVLWDTPELLQVIHSQKVNGIYQTISDEVSRRRILGSIPANTKFIDAYQAVGQELQAQGKLGARQAGSVSSPTRISKVSNNKQAKSAGITRSSKGTHKKFINPLAMSDDEFMKQFDNRL